MTCRPFFCVLPLLAAGLSDASAADPKSIAPLLWIGEPSPELVDVGWIGDAPGLAGEDDRLTVIEFWATWCRPCLESLPKTVRLVGRHADRVRLLMLATQDEETVRGFLRKRASSALDAPTWDELLADAAIGLDPASVNFRRYQSAVAESGLPAAFLIDADGRLLWCGHPERLAGPLEAAVAGTWDWEQAAAELAADAMRQRVRRFLTDGIADADRYAAARAEIDREIERATTEAARPALESVRRQTYLAEQIKRIGVDIGEQPEARRQEIASIVSRLDAGEFTLRELIGSQDFTNLSLGALQNEMRTRAEAAATSDAATADDHVDYARALEDEFDEAKAAEHLAGALGKDWPPDDRERLLRLRDQMRFAAMMRKRIEARRQTRTIIRPPASASPAKKPDAPAAGTPDVERSPAE